MLPKTGAKSSQLIFSQNLPAPAQIGAENFLIYDRLLEKKSPALRRWIASFPARYGVSSGEDLKGVENFPGHMARITAAARHLSTRQMTIVVLGGGSVGDFGGFVASVFKRGVRLVHIPSTWLAAIDSAHGGKTALNVQGAKNQIGTFYPAARIYLVKNVLQSQPEIRAHEAFAEMYKVALMQGGSFWRQFSQNSGNSQTLWKFLPAAIKAKYAVVKKDPQEISGHRHLLNFGHTMGHVFESLLQIPHGIAVNYGLRFALDWSLERGLMNEKTAQQVMSSPASGFLLSPLQDGFLANKYHRKMRELLLSDKKKTGRAQLRFIFCQKPGVLKILPVTIDQVMQEVVRQSQV